MFEKLYAYQKSGAHWLVSKKNAMLAWDMGTGKTPTTVVAADLAGAGKILVVCPSVARSVWRDAFTQWSQQPRAITVLHSGVQPVPRDATQVVIVSYDLLSRKDSLTLALILKQKWDLTICDEAHALKASDANRTRAVYGKRCDGSGVAGASERVWVLTGTPVLNNSSEFWTHLHALAPETIHASGFSPKPLTESQFQERYCSLAPTPFGVRITGSRNLQELAARIAPFVSRVRKQDVLKDRPPVTWGVLPINPNHVKIDADLMRQFKEAEAAAHQTLDEIESADDALAALQANSFHLMTSRRLTGLVKVAALAEAVSTELDSSDGKIIIFAHHTAVIDGLMQKLVRFNPVKIDGRDNDNAGDAAIHKFQNVSTCRVFVGQIKKCSAVITLTAASNVLLAEADWTPKNNEQAVARADRIGQMHAVTARIAVLEGTTDARLLKILQRKTKDIDALEASLLTA